MNSDYVILHLATFRDDIRDPFAVLNYCQPHFVPRGGKGGHGSHVVHYTILAHPPCPVNEKVSLIFVPDLNRIIVVAISLSFDEIIFTHVMKRDKFFQRCFYRLPFSVKIANFTFALEIGYLSNTGNLIPKRHLCKLLVSDAEGLNFEVMTVFAHVIYYHRFRKSQTLLRIFFSPMIERTGSLTTLGAFTVFFLETEKAKLKRKALMKWMPPIQQKEKKSRKK